MQEGHIQRQTDKRRATDQAAVLDALWRKTEIQEHTFHHNCVTVPSFHDTRRVQTEFTGQK